MWCLSLLATALAIRSWRTEQVLPIRDQLVLLSAPAVIFLVASMKCGFSQHGRYVLPCFPFLYVWVATAISTSTLEQPKRFFRAFIVVATCWAWGSSLATFPHSISYFNEIAGGPKGGPRHLLHSNIDWGQDLRKLAKWIERHPDAQPMHVAYYGPVSPAAAGVSGVLPVLPYPSSVEGGDRSYPPGWYAISVNLVHGVSYSIQKGKSSTDIPPVIVDPDFWKTRRPKAMAGYSIYIYEIPETPEL